MTNPNRKQEVRKQALQRRDGMTPEQRTVASNLICNKIAMSEAFINARGIHVYKAMGSEVQLEPLIELALELGKTLGMMVVLADSAAAQYTIGKNTKFSKHPALGILQPDNTQQFDLDICDLVLVPVVAADARCNRLGYGKGFYDHFLMQHPRPAFGVAFDSQVFDDLPVDDNDVTLDAIYTETRIILPDDNAD